MFETARLVRIGFIGLGLTLPYASAIFGAQNSPGEQNPISNARFKIAGTVVNSLDGAPLGQARVSIADTTDRANAVALITPSNGHFEFDGLKVGKFALNGARRAFLPGAYDQHEQYSTAIVTGKGLDTEHLVLRLTPFAVITGTVFDELGDPARNARVMLFGESHSGGMKRIVRFGADTTDDQGTYEFPSLAPGSYFVSVTARPWYAVRPAYVSTGNGAGPSPGVARTLDVAYPTTYFGGATEAEGATALEVKGGDRAQADVHLNPVSALRLVFRVPEGQGYSMPTFRKRVFDSTEFIQGEATQSGSSPNVIELTGIPAGRYIVQFTDPQSGQLAQSSEVDLVRDGQELDSERGELAATAKLSVKIPREDGLPRQLFVGLQDSRRRMVAYKPMDAVGRVTLEGLQAGKYSILAISPPKRYSVYRISSQGTEIPGQELTVTAGSSLDLTIYLVAGVVRIEGFAKRNDKAVAGAMVVLVPKDPESDVQIFRRDQSDFDGSFVLRDVIPGSYTIVAVQDAWDFAWLQPGVLARYVQHGQNLTIGELMKGSFHLPDPVEVQPR